uniref:Uncharacterized protein n=2 Tax=Aegilops tauschii subsp. strangulata TaxID=200361 RepID=A0A453QIB0_AEGTS
MARRRPRSLLLRRGTRAAPPPPLMYSCPGYGYGSGLPSPTPSDEDPEHFKPPGYDPLPEFSSPPAAVPLDAPKPRLVINLLPKVKTEEIEAAAPTLALLARRDLNLPALEVEEEERQVAARPSALPTLSPEARVLLRRFASAMAVRPAGARAGTWSPEALGLTGRVADLRPMRPPPNSPPPLRRGRAAAEGAGRGHRRGAGPSTGDLGVEAFGVVPNLSSGRSFFLTGMLQPVPTQATDQNRPRLLSLVMCSTNIILFVLDILIRRTPSLYFLAEDLYGFCKSIS